MKVAANNIMRSPWNWGAEPFKIADNLYYVGDREVSVHMLDTGEGLLLLDTGYTMGAYLLLESIRALGFDPRNIKWILHTHGHLDHFGCTRILMERYGCKTYFPEKDLPMLDERKDLNWHEELGVPYEPPFDQYFVPDYLVKPGDVLQFGNTKVEAFAAGGHTPGALCYRFTLPGGLRAAMHGGIGTNTMSAAYAKKKNLGRTWRDTFIRDLKKLYSLEVDIVLGNHPYQSSTFQKWAGMTEGNNPFIDPSEWQRWLHVVEEKSHWKLEREDPIL